MAGFTQNIFGRGKIQFIPSKSVSFKKYFEALPSVDDFKMFFAPIFHRDPLKKFLIEIKYHLSNEFLSNNDKVLQELIQDHKHFIGDEKSILESISKSSQITSETTSDLSPPTIHNIPSSKKLLNRPWLIKVQTNNEGKPPILKCYAIDEEGEIIEVEGKPSLIPPILGPEANKEEWKPKNWKPIRQTLKLHEITPSPKCPKHQHLQKSKRYELIRETLLQATIITTNKDKEEDKKRLNQEFSQDHFNHRLRKLSSLKSPNWIPPKWQLPKEDEETIAKDDNVKKDESSSTSKSSSTSDSSSTSEKDNASGNDKQKLEEEKKKHLEDKKKEKKKKKKRQDEAQRLWRLALREAAGQAGFMGAYATRVGGLGRPF